MSIRTNMLAVAAFAMASCSMVQTSVAPESTAGIAAVEAEIVQAVENAERANVSAVVDWTPRVVSILPEGAMLPSEAVQLIDVEWNGPIEDLLEDLAARAGFEFAVTGDAPEESAMVQISTRDEPLWGVAVRASYHASERAAVALDPAAGLLELRWMG